MGVANWTLTTPWNLAGFPAASVPAGTSADGLPLAVQIVVAPGGQALLLRVLQQLEHSRPWPRLTRVPGAEANRRSKFGSIADGSSSS